MRIAAVLTLITGILTFAGGFSVSPAQAQELRGDTVLEYVCRSDTSGRCTCRVIADDAPDAVLDLKNRVRCQIRDSGDVFMILNSRVEYVPGTQVIGVETGSETASCDNAPEEEFTPSLRSMRTRVRERGTNTFLTVQAQVKLCDPTIT